MEIDITDPQVEEAIAKEIPMNLIPYNTGMPQMKLPELGRNVHNLVAKCITIEDREERNRCAEEIVKIMAKMHPSMVGPQGDTHKLWDALQIISDFQLDVDSPYERLTKEQISEKGRAIPYTQGHVKNRIYGASVAEMVMRALEKEDGEEKDELIYTLANFMKRIMHATNPQNATDERVLKDLHDISGGLIQLNAETYKLQPITKGVQQKKTRVTQRKKRTGKK